MLWVYMFGNYVYVDNKGLKVIDINHPSSVVGYLIPISYNSVYDQVTAYVAEILSV
jgi:hypothetical protein